MRVQSGMIAILGVIFMNLIREKSGSIDLQEKAAFMLL